MKVGVVVKKGSMQAHEIGLKLRDVGERLGLEVCFEDTGVDKKIVGNVCTFSASSHELPERVVVIGGDGTLLRFLHNIPRDTKPPLLMTIRAGRRGFFFDVEPYEAEERFVDFLRGRYTVFEYERLVASLDGSTTNPALNEVAVLSYEGKVTRLTVSRDEEKIYSLDGDGVIVATTAGSTAYALSAGGPILDPELQAIVVAPLNPIQLHLRPVVLNVNSEVSVEVRSGSSEAKLVVDGNVLGSLSPGVELRIKRAFSPVRIARFGVEEFYERLFTRILQYW